LSIFIEVSYKSLNIPGTFDYNKNDLLQSPIALALLKSYLLSPVQLHVDFKAPCQSIVLKVKDVDNTPYRLILTKDLIAHARYYRRIKNEKDANKLYNTFIQLTHDSTLEKYLDEAVIAETGYIIYDNIYQRIF
jgi:hypothetical protein